jgi:hypothetical protein
MTKPPRLCGIGFQKYWRLLGFCCICEPVGSPSDKPIHTAVYALIRDFQAIPGAGPIFVGGDERHYRAGFAPGFSRI